MARYAAVGMEYGRPVPGASSEGLVFKPEDFELKHVVLHKPKRRAQEQPGVASASSRSVSKTTKGKDRLKPGAEDPLAEFYAEAKVQAEHNGRAGVRS